MAPKSVYEVRAVLANNQAAHVRSIGNYFTAGNVGNSGALFETFGGRGDVGPDKDRFTYTDCFAPSFLSVDAPPTAAFRLVEGNYATSTAEKLAGIPTQTHLNAEVWGEYGKTVDGLFQQLKELHGIGWVTASKLIARKRPDLVPVLDNVVYHALKLPDYARDAWKLIADYMNDTDIQESLSAIRAGAVATYTPEKYPDALNLAGIKTLSPISVFDICVWNEHSGHLKGSHPDCFFK